MTPPHEPTDPSGIPPSIELAWGLRSAGSRGPKRGLSLDAIVAAGIAIAGSEGLDAVSMARVAREVGVGTMSLYRYVLSKDELLTLMVDTGLGPPPQSASGESWRDGLTRWAFGIRAAYLAHPWSLSVPITAPPLGPNNVAWLENALHAMRDTPLSEPDKVSTLLLLSGFTRDASTLAANIRAAAAAAAAGLLDAPPPSYGAILRQLTDPAAFPAVHRAIASGTFDDDDYDDFDADFRFGLERILDGVQVLIDRS